MTEKFFRTRKIFADVGLYLKALLRVESRGNVRDRLV
jgi:hypothetical protein